MAEHECVIGLLDSTRLVTISDIKEHIADRNNYNIYLREMGIVTAWLYKKEWTLKDYADKRKSTNLTRFGFCPECGKEIDWKSIRRADNG